MEPLIESVHLVSRSKNGIQSMRSYPSKFDTEDYVFVDEGNTTFHYFVHTTPDASRLIGYVAVQTLDIDTYSLYEEAEGADCIIIVLLSKYPYHTTFFQVTTELLRVAQAPDKFEREIRRLVDTIPSPWGTNIKLVFPVGQLMLTIQDGPIPGYPIHQLPLENLFRMCPVNKVLILLKCILLEYKLVVTSQSPFITVFILESLVALLYPLQLASVYVPLLPYSHIELCQSPVPFLFGIPANEPRYLVERVKETTNDVVVYDADTKTMHPEVPGHVPNGTLYLGGAPLGDIPEFPKALETSLRGGLTKSRESYATPGGVPKTKSFGLTSLLTPRRGDGTNRSSQDPYLGSPTSAIRLTTPSPTRLDGRRQTAPTLPNIPQLNLAALQSQKSQLMECPSDTHIMEVHVGVMTEMTTNRAKLHWDVRRNVRSFIASLIRHAAHEAGGVCQELFNGVPYPDGPHPFITAFRKSQIFQSLIESKLEGQRRPSTILLDHMTGVRDFPKVESLEPEADFIELHIDTYAKGLPDLPEGAGCWLGDCPTATIQDFDSGLLQFQNLFEEGWNDVDLSKPPTRDFGPITRDFKSMCSVQSDAGYISMAWLVLLLRSIGPHVPYKTLDTTLKAIVPLLDRLWDLQVPNISTLVSLVLSALWNVNAGATVMSVVAWANKRGVRVSGREYQDLARRQMMAPPLTVEEAPELIMDPIKAVQKLVEGMHPVVKFETQRIPMESISIREEGGDLLVRGPNAAGKMRLAAPLEVFVWACEVKDDAHAKGMFFQAAWYFHQTNLPWGILLLRDSLKQIKPRASLVLSL